MYTERQSSLLQYIVNCESVYWKFQFGTQSLVQIHKKTQAHGMFNSLWLTCNHSSSRDTYSLVLLQIATTRRDENYFEGVCVYLVFVYMSFTHSITLKVEEKLLATIQLNSTQNVLRIFINALWKFMQTLLLFEQFARCIFIGEPAALRMPLIYLSSIWKCFLSIVSFIIYVWKLILLTSLEIRIRLGIYVWNECTIFKSIGDSKLLFSTFF